MISFYYSFTRGLSMPGTFEASIGELIGSTRRERIIVPQFQRGYAWDKKHVEAFWKDIVEFQQESGSTDGPKRYFLGPVVVLQKPQDRVWELLDGQQRLATTTILLSILRDHAKAIPGPAAVDFAKDTQTNFIKKDGLDTMELGETDALFFRELIQNDPPSKGIPKIRTHRNIVSAKDILSGKVAEIILGSTPQAALAVLRELRQTLISDLYVACIPVESEKDAFKIFETLNDRGLRLSAPDLLLNLLMRQAKESERKTIRDLWTEMVEEIGQFEMKDFLRALWVSKYGDIKKSNLYTSIRNHVVDNQLNPLDFVRECSEECDAFVSIVSVDEGKLGVATKHVTSLISDLNAEVAIPLLLSCKKKFEEEDFSKVCQWILVFITRYAIMGNLDRSGVENIFYSLAKQTREQVSAPVALEKIKSELEAACPTDEQIASEKITLSPTEARYVLVRIAMHMQSRGKELAPTDYANIEHIFPKNPEENEWGGHTNQDILAPYLWHIGNLTLMGGKINMRNKNSEFALKKVNYKKSSLEMTLQLDKNYDKWDQANILNRARQLTKIAKEIWNFKNLSRV